MTPISKKKKKYHKKLNILINLNLFTVSASFVPGAEANTTRQRHAPLYGRLVAEEHLPVSHRDAVIHQVHTFYILNTMKL